MSRLAAALISRTPPSPASDLGALRGPSFFPALDGGEFSSRWTVRTNTGLHPPESAGCPCVVSVSLSTINHSFDGCDSLSRPLARPSQVQGIGGPLRDPSGWGRRPPDCHKSLNDPLTGAVPPIARRACRSNQWGWLAANSPQTEGLILLRLPQQNLWTLGIAARQIPRAPCNFRMPACRI